MSDYSPVQLSAKWLQWMDPFLEETQALWEKGRPRKRFFSFGLPEHDAYVGEYAPSPAKAALLYEGEVVWGMIARAFFAAYLPGKNTHYGSVIYSTGGPEFDSVFELAWKVNELRQDNSPPPPGTQAIAQAMRNDRSDFARLMLPREIDESESSYLANLCIHRTRLSGGYLHERLLPILICPKKTPWCCILPLRFWSAQMKDVWLAGSPANDPVRYQAMLKKYNIEP